MNSIMIGHQRKFGKLCSKIAEPDDERSNLFMDCSMLYSS